MKSRPPIFVANWKMNAPPLRTYVETLAGELATLPGKLSSDYEVALAPQNVYLQELSKYMQNTRMKLASQNCGPAKSGAYTGEVSANALKQISCASVILGHSERRHIFKEDNALVASRVKAALEEGLEIIFCVGEQMPERKAAQTFQAIENQLTLFKGTGPFEKISIAYEPVWAIGTGENATPEQAEEVHVFIRNRISKYLTATLAERLRILYGGSVKPENSQSLMAQKDVDGLLVGGASLDPITFANIIKNGLQSSK